MVMMMMGLRLPLIVIRLLLREVQTEVIMDRDVYLPQEGSVEQRERARCESSIVQISV